MKLVMDEKVKHRLIGLAVILSIAAIFAPAIMKKSNQRFDDNVSVSVELPPKPLQPNLAIANEKTMFAAVKVAHVEIPELINEQPLPTIAKAESLSQMNESKLKEIAPIIAKAEVPSIKKPKPVALTLAQAERVGNKVIAFKKLAGAQKATPKKVAPKSPIRVVAKNKNSGKKPAAVNLTKNGYAVQLATFSKQQNADSLVHKLRGKGYKASYNKIKTNAGTMYKVIVGQAQHREKALDLQKQLAAVMQIKGFIVTTG